MISVIIPVYNVEKYLRRCLDSVIHQTYQDLEIILVDDGSTDNSPTICDEYQKLDSRIKVIHKENGGLSDARNVGFSSSKSDYVFFLDSDDWLHEEALNQLFMEMKKYHADISIANFSYYSDDNEFVNAQLDATVVLNKKQAMEELLKNKMIKNFAWGKLYKRNLLENCPFPKGKLFEDTYWTHLVFDRAEVVVQVKEVLVYYYQRKTSISYTYNEKRVHLIEGYMERRKFVEMKYPEFLSLTDEAIINLMYGIYVESIKRMNLRLYFYVRTYILKTIKKMNICTDKVNSDVALKHKCLSTLPERCLFLKIKEKL